MGARHPERSEVLVQVPGGYWGKVGKEHAWAQGRQARCSPNRPTTYVNSFIGHDWAELRGVCVEWETLLCPCADQFSAKVLRDCRLDVQLTYLRRVLTVSGLSVCLSICLAACLGLSHL
ncbi:hypothetical protein CGRA01v4_12048 [Colletotrichum graminicola]|nr:hypothetical protein CGRA01v4_12048 [Colletotrichum graminicola]